MTSPQMQNPNIMPPSINSNPMAGAAVGKKGHWALIVIILILLVGFFVAWMYVKQMDYGFQQVQTPTQAELDAAEDARLSQEIQSADPANLDAEFQTIDQDINSL